MLFLVRSPRPVARRALSAPERGHAERRALASQEVCPSQAAHLASIIPSRAHRLLPPYSRTKRSPRGTHLAEPTRSGDAAVALGLTERSPACAGSCARLSSPVMMTILALVVLGHHLARICSLQSACLSYSSCETIVTSKNVTSSCAAYASWLSAARLSWHDSSQVDAPY